MSKLRKTILIIGILVVAVAASLGTALALYATGSMKTDTVELEYVLLEKEKVYDGTPLKLDDSLNDISLNKGKLAKGHTARYEFSGSQTNVGTSMSDATVKIYDENGFNVTSDYSIKVVGAPLTVTAKSISVELPSQKVVYNGSKVLFNEYNITENANGELAGLCSGHKIYGSTDASLMNVGDTLPEDLTPLIFDVAGNDVTANYEIEFTPGEIEVIPRHISVRPVSKEKVYDGVTMYADEIECIDGSLVEGQYVKFEINENYENKITDAGTVDTEITKLKIFDFINGEEVDVTANYEIDTYETGTLTVSKRHLTVTAKSGVFTYNGEEQSLMDETAAESVEGLADGEELLSVSYAGALTDVGVTGNRIIGILLSGSEDNYERSLINGKIEIKPYELHLETASAEKYYDGTPLSNAQFETEFSLANNEHTLAVGGNGELPEITDAGEKSNAYAVTVLNGETDCTANYAITYTYGTLTVKKLPVKVTLNAEEHVTYDGGEHSPTLGDETEGNSPYFDVQPALGEDETVDSFTLDYTHFEVVSDARIMRDKGEYRYTVKFSDKNFDNNYALEVPESGYLTIDARQIKVTTGSLSKPYSGKKLTDESYVLDGTLVDGHSFKLPLTYPSVTNVGKVFNEYTMGVKDENGADVTANYDVDYTYGELTVSELPITVTLKNYRTTQAFTYTGKAVTLSAADAITGITTSAADVRVSDVVDNDDFTVVTAGEIIDAGTNYTYTVKFTDKEFAKNFKLTIKDGNGLITVKALPVTVTVKDVERVYNGAKQTIDAYDTVNSISNTTTGLTRDDFVISYTNPGLDQINASNYPFTVYVCDAKKNNYELTVQNMANANESGAMFKISKFEVEVTTASQAFVYNGADQTDNTFTHGALANTAHTMYVTTSAENLPSVCNVGDTAKNKLEYVIRDAWNNLVTDNYTVKENNGTLSVTPFPITVTTATTEIIYNGNDLTDGTATANVGLFNGHEIASPAEEDLPCQHGVGSLKNEFYVDILGNQGVESVKDNYSITYIFGTLTVKPREIVVTTADAEQVYNGYALSKTDGITISGLSDDMELNFYADLKEGAKECSITNVGTAPNQFECAIYYAGEGDVTENFTLRYVYGTLKVTPLSVSVLLNDFSDQALEYDGRAKTFEVADAIISLLINGEEHRLSDAGSPDDGGIEGYAAGDGSEEGITFSSSDFTIVYPSLILDAGTYTYSVKFADENYAKNFLLEQVAPTVRVKKMSVELYLKEYTGEDKLTFDNNVKTLDVADAVTAVLDAYGNSVDESLLKPEDFTVIYPTEMRSAGDYTYRVKITYDYKAKNFTFDETTFANVTVDKFALTVALGNLKQDYSGTEFALPANALTLLTDTQLIKAADFTLKFDDGAAIDAGTYTYSAEITDKTFAQNFNLEIDRTDDDANGTVTITPLKISATLNPLTLTFNGNVQKIDGGAAFETDCDLVGANDFTFRVLSDGAEAELRNAGDYTYEVTLTNGNFMFDGGVNTVTGGVITINKLSVTVTLNNFVKEYDGEEYQLTPDTAIYAVSGNVFDRYDFDVTYADGLVSHADAGAYNMEVSLTEANLGEEENIELKTVNGKISISKKTVTVATASKTFVYNGEAQSATDPVVTGALFGHEVKVADSGWAEITDVGTTPNNSEYEIYYLNDDGEEVIVTANYKVVYVYGTLTVTPRAITVTTDSATKPYDGTPLTKATYTEAGLVDGHSIIVPAEADLPSITNAGTAENAYTVTVKSGVKDLTGNYTVNYVYGTLEVTAVDITLTLRDVSKAYTGADITVTADEAIERVEILEDTDFTVTLSQAVVNAGTYSFTVSLTDGQLAKNYNVKTEGSNVLTVTKLNLAVTLKDVVNAEYTGKAHKATAANVVNVGANLDGITAASFTFTYEEDMLNVGNYTYGAEITDETMRGNYTLNVTGGAYEIVPTEITVTLKNYVETYANCNFTVDVYDAITSIEGNCKALLGKSDFVPNYVDTLRLAGDYAYEVEIGNVEKSKNFTLNFVGGSYKINKRKLVVVFTDVELSASEFEEIYGSDEYASNFDVTANVTLSSTNSVASGDSFRVISATAEGLGENYLGLYTIASYELTNEDCYEFINLDGSTPIRARLKIIA